MSFSLVKFPKNETNVSFFSIIKRDGNGKHFEINRRINYYNATGCNLSYRSRSLSKISSRFWCEWDESGWEKSEKSPRTREAKEKRIDEGVYSLGMLFSDIQIYTGEMFHR